MSRVVVMHGQLGCDTGCCGHWVEVDGEQVSGFHISHPNGSSEEEKIAFAKELITEELGPEHVKDLDWEHCVVLDD